MQATLDIACAINNHYLLPLAVMLTSLKAHLSARYRPVLHLIHAGLSQASIDTIASIIETRAIRPDFAALSNAPRDQRFPPEAAFPLLVADLLPDLPRVLFLDADMLVLDDLGKLWETTLDGQHALGAVADAAIPLCSGPRAVKDWRARGIPGDAPYFNAGVMLINTRRWRELEIGREVTGYFEAVRNEPVDFLHQEALNAVLWRHWKPLDTRWNLIAGLAGRRFHSSCSQAWRQPGIVHFAGRMKPWRFAVGGPFNEPYQKEILNQVQNIPAQPSGLGDRLAGFYDRHLREVLHPIERILWEERII